MEPSRFKNAALTERGMGSAKSVALALPANSSTAVERLIDEYIIAEIYDHIESESSATVLL